MTTTRRFRLSSDETAAALAEYILLLGFVCLGCIAALGEVGREVGETFDTAAVSLETTIAEVEDLISDHSSIDVPTDDAGNEDGDGREIDPLCHMPAGMTLVDGRFRVEGQLVVDSANNGTFAFGRRGGGKQPQYSRITPGYQKEQEWYGDLLITLKPNGPYYWYRPTYIFPPGWDPMAPGC